MIKGYETTLLSFVRDETVCAEKLFRDHITAFKPDDGWLARQSAVSRWPDDNPQSGVILDAELFRADATMILRRNQQAWRITTISEGKGEEVLFDRQFQVSVHHGLMEYRRYWRRENGAYAPFAYRLAAFCNVPTGTT